MLQTLAPLQGLLPFEGAITPPKLDYTALAPLIVVFVAACLGVVVEGVLRRRIRDEAQLIVAGLGLIGALVFTVQGWTTGKQGIHAMGSVAIDGPSYFVWGLLLVVGLLVVLMMSERTLNGGAMGFAPMAAAVPGSPIERRAIELKVEHTEIYPLTMFAIFGMMLFASSNDLITMFVALEVFSLPLYLLSGLARRRRLLSQEAALKYFLLGSLSSAFFLYGTALLYGFAGGFELRTIDAAVGAKGPSSLLLLAGLGLVAVGLLFKVGVVPFHSWTPDVYTGAPTPITGFMAIATKAAAVVALLRILYVGLGAMRWEWAPLLAALSVLTMLVGSVIALTQSDMKRLLAYSSIAHAGFLLVPMAAAVTVQTATSGALTSSVGSILFYLSAYGFATLGAFALITMVRKAGGESTSLASWAGVGRRHPVFGACMVLFLLSFAGIPLTGGFMGKLMIFLAGWSGGYAWLVLVAVLMSLVAAFFYLKVVVVMFFREPGEAAEGVTVEKASWLTWVAVVVGVIGTLLLGLWSGPLADLAARMSVFLR
ncbi:MULTISPECIES: NADH-quinone oxidoreductase subunit NuoN [Aestuariimicrobium]|uniref:NADH-quinone oxidoreductase subunit NuoN n=1 Tax=Aestuariimicrobium TaxID=396388 RepID=UPI0003B58479|nr:MULTISPECIES: NADH-quinone oxidoreductase subunit NuoN [Aestuariimicrobium]CAI9406070.1 NADH-quinone oxidoreductase subunit N [Aestuariimicrobium sp. T2.26MG-19.2B]